MRYAEALTAFRVASEHRRAARAHELLDRLLRLFGERYARAKREASGLDFEDLELECRELLRADAGAPRALPRRALRGSWSTSSRTPTRSSSS